MMTAYAKRLHSRNHYEAPIRYANFDTPIYHPSRIFNFSRGGMYLEPLQPLFPESQIYIRMVNYHPGSYGPEAYRSYIAEIRWCREIKNVDKKKYGVGVRILSKSHGFFDETVEDQRIPCDLCGKLCHEKDLHHTNDFLKLCPDCHTHLCAIPGGRVKDSIERFLLGNVL